MALLSPVRIATSRVRKVLKSAFSAFGATLLSRLTSCSEAAAGKAGVGLEPRVRGNRNLGGRPEGPLEHPVQAANPLRGMHEGPRGRAQDGETQGPPQVHGGGVGLYDGVELDRPEARRASPVQDVLTELATDAFPWYAGSTMKEAVATWAPLPGRFGPILAEPRMVSASQSTTVRPGACSIHHGRACSMV